jgi:hypothetical protein
MDEETTYEVVCHLQCPWCRRKALRVTQASAQRAVSAYLAHLDNLPLAARAEAYGRLTPSMYHFRFCRHCQESSENFLLATIRDKRTIARAQRVVAPTIPFTWADELRFSPHE